MGTVNDSLRPLTRDQLKELFAEMRTGPTIAKAPPVLGRHGLVIRHLTHQCPVCNATLTGACTHYGTVDSKEGTALLLLMVCHGCKSYHALANRLVPGSRDLRSLSIADSEPLWLTYYREVMREKNRPWWDLWGRIEYALRRLM